MNDLFPLYQGLIRVRRFRQTVRGGSALSLVIGVLLWALLGFMLLDVALDMGKLERGVSLLIFLALAAWLARAYLAPLRDFQESDVETASLIERKHGMSTDLVAAMQFSDGGRTQFGSPELRLAAVQYTVSVIPGLDYLEGFSRSELNQRLGFFGLSALAFLGVMFAFPAHGAAFMNRFFLGSAHYPTDTVIEQVVSPGDVAPFGLPLDFTVKVGGVLPESGTVKLRTLTGGLGTVIDLLPDSADPGLYKGTLPRAMDDFSYQVFLGDAYTDARKVRLTPLAVVEVDFDIQAPEYAAKRFAARAGARKGKVALQGSRVVAKISSSKGLRSATMALDDEPFPLRKADDLFVLDATNSPLHQVEKTLRWEVQVEDVDGLALEHPVSGVLQVRPDQPPSIGIATVTRLIWPGAEPTIHFKAIDDYALARVTAHVALQRMDAAGVESLDGTEIPIAAAEKGEIELEGTHVLNVKSLNLRKGDRVFVTFDAVDFRGAIEGRTTHSEPLVLEVSDREGVLEALREQDSEIERRLDQIINAQLGVGE